MWRKYGTIKEASANFEIRGMQVRAGDGMSNERFSIGHARNLVIDRPYLQSSAPCQHACGTQPEHTTGSTPTTDPVQFRLPLPPLSNRSPGYARHRVTPAAKGNLRPRLLLASTQRMSQSDDSKIQQSVLAQKNLRVTRLET